MALMVDAINSNNYTNMYKCQTNSLLVINEMKKKVKKKAILLLLV